MEKWIRMQGLKLMVSIGIHDFEKNGPQPYLLNIGLRINNQYWAHHESISETVDYDQLRSQVTQLLQSKHFNLQETVIQNVMDLCFALDIRVEAVDVETAKTSVYPDCNHVGLHYIATRSEWFSRNTR